MTIQHNYFESAGAAFIEYLDRLFKPFAQSINQSFPIFILNTGDEAFLTNKYSKESSKKTETLYSFSPRMSLDVKGFDLDFSQLTNRNVLGSITGTNEEEFQETFVTPVRRIPVNWTIQSEISFNNIIEYLLFCEIFLTSSHHNHYFTFYYAGTEYNCVFGLQEDIDSNANLTLAFDTDKRFRKLPLTFVLSLQYPAFDIYKIGLHQNNPIPAGQTMTKLIHKLHVKNCASDAVDHITTETTENGTKMV